MSNIVIQRLSGENKNMIKQDKQDTIIFQNSSKKNSIASSSRSSIKSDVNEQFYQENKNAIKIALSNLLNSKFEEAKVHLQNMQSLKHEGDQA